MSDKARVARGFLVLVAGLFGCMLIRELDVVLVFSRVSAAARSSGVT
jgi:hypothetical protein